GLDDKVLADWNGLMIAGLANAGVAFGEPEWLAMAAHAFMNVESHMGRGDRLGHSWRAGKLLFPGLASHPANLVRPALSAAGAARPCGGGRWRGGVAPARHYAKGAPGGYFLTADDAEGLVVRPNSTADEATPNPNSVAAHNLLRLAVVTGQDAWRAHADRLFDGVIPLAADNIFMHLALVNALDLPLRAAGVVIAA